MRDLQVMWGMIARCVVGLGLGVIGSIVGYFAGWMVFGPGSSLTAATALLTSGMGVGAGVGSFPAWLDLDRPRLAQLRCVGLSLLGGILGAWGGSYYAVIVFDVDVKTQDARVTALAAAAVGANLGPALWSLGTGLARRS